MKKTLVFILAVAMVLTLLPATALAATTGNWTDIGNYDITWYDSSATVYNIEDAADLAGFAAIINQVETSISNSVFSGKTIQLSNDIDLSAHYWVPIDAYGKKADLSNFTFDGNGKTISNMSVNTGAYNNGTTYFYSGFFGQTASVMTIKNVIFSNANVTPPLKANGATSNTNGVAVVVGLAYSNTTFENIKVTNSAVNGFGKVGTFLGFSGGDGPTMTFTNCEAYNNNITGCYDVGGVAGLIHKKDSAVITNFKMSGCTITGTASPTITYDGKTYWKYEATGSYYIYGISATAYCKYMDDEVPIDGLSIGRACMPVDFAAHVGDNWYLSANEAMESTTKVLAGVESSYTIVIPASVNFGTLTKGTGVIKKEFDVTAQNLIIDNGAKVQVMVASDFNMKNGTDEAAAKLAYSLFNQATGGTALATGTEFASFTAGGTHDGRAEVNTNVITAAGSYQGTMVFTISYIPAP